MVDDAAPSKVWIVHCDGSAVPNPGRMAVGAHILSPQGEMHSLSRALHAVGCNNEAELRALLAALLHVQGLGAGRVQVFTDNSVLLDHLVGGQAPGLALRPVARLMPLFDQAAALMQSFESVQLNWVPRHRNAQADALARAAQGLAPKPATRQGHVKGRRKKR